MTEVEQDMEKGDRIGPPRNSDEHAVAGGEHRMPTDRRQDILAEHWMIEHNSDRKGPAMPQLVAASRLLRGSPIPPLRAGAPSRPALLLPRPPPDERDIKEIRVGRMILGKREGGPMRVLSLRRAETSLPEG